MPTLSFSPWSDRGVHDGERDTGCVPLRVFELKALLEDGTEGPGIPRDGGPVLERVGRREK